MRRKTSRVKKRKSKRQIELQVRSPRIVGFGILRGMGKFAKLALVLLVLGAAVWGGREGLNHVFIENPEFQLKYIEMPGATMTQGDLAEITGIDPGASIFAVDMSAMEAEMRKRPGIVRIEVSRHLPDTLKVELVERIPVAWIECRRLGIIGRDPATGVVVDRDGVCFPCEKWWEKEGATLPEIVVREATELDFAIGERLRHREAERGLDLVQRSSHLLAGSNWSLPVVGVKNDFSLVAATNEGAVVTFGMYEHDRQLNDLLAILKHAKSSQRQLATANMIPKRNVPVTFAGDSPVRSEARPANVEGTRLERDIRAILNQG